MWLSRVPFALYNLNIHNYSLKMFLSPRSESEKTAESILARAPKPTGSAWIARNSCCPWPTRSISCLMRLLTYPGPLSADAAHFVVFLPYWKITSCLENTQNTVASSSAGLSKFHQQPSPQRASVGEAARFECQIEGVPTPVITWEKDKAAVPQEAR